MVWNEAGIIKSINVMVNVLLDASYPTRNPERQGVMRFVFFYWDETLQFWGNDL